MVRRLIRQTYTFISTHPAFHRSGVYALLLVAILELIARWPVDDAFIWVLIDNPGLMFLDYWTWTTACSTALFAGLIGLTRHSWLDRLAGLAAIWPSQVLLGFWLGFEDGLIAALSELLFSWIMLGPLTRSLQIANDRPSGAILLFAIYLALAWLIARIAFAVFRDRINRLGGRWLRLDGLPTGDRTEP
jgi:hypothetical protein